jgi:hypothetical protein
MSVFGLIKITNSQFSAYAIPSPRRVGLDPSSVVHVTSQIYFCPLHSPLHFLRGKRTQKAHWGIQKISKTQKTQRNQKRTYQKTQEMSNDIPRCTLNYHELKDLRKALLEARNLVDYFSHWSFLAIYFIALHLSSRYHL